MHSFRPLAIIFLLLMSFSTSTPATSDKAPPPKTPSCTCKYLIARSFFSEGACGACSLCFWNLYYFAKTFSEAGLSASDYQSKFVACAKRIGTNPTYEPDAECSTWNTDCGAVTQTFFETQCKTLYPSLKAPPAVDSKSMSTFRLQFNATTKRKKLPKFDGSSELHYPQSCPSHHRRYQFTFYMLFAAAGKKYNVSTASAWDEELGLPQIAAKLSTESLQFAINRTKKVFERFGYSEETINPRRFCGHKEDLICVEEEDLGGEDKTPPKDPGSEAGADKTPPKDPGSEAGADKTPPKDPGSEAGADKTPPKDPGSEAGDKTPPKDPGPDSGADKTPPESGADKPPESDSESVGA